MNKITLKGVPEGGGGGGNSSRGKMHSLHAPFLRKKPAFV